LEIAVAKDVDLAEAEADAALAADALAE